jgi:cyclopropane-fatty-acyl-phospholipid synthase
MMYSAAIFENQQTSLHDAQIARMRHICERLQLKPDDHVLEIGTGWGGFALFAAQNYGCRVTTTTISQEQYDKAKQRVDEAGLEDQITLLFEDFRKLQGQYDKLVSIEMIEAIDHALFDSYFSKCSELLKADGAMLIQAITIADQRYAEYHKSIDFIQRYIFPGSGLPSSAVMTDCVARMTDMRLLGLEDIGLHYATTLQRWRENFFAGMEQVREQGFSSTFIRMWEFYLCYCEGAFLERAISDVQILFAKPESQLKTL